MFWKNKKNIPKCHLLKFLSSMQHIVNLSSADLAQGVVTIKHIYQIAKRAFSNLISMEHGTLMNTHDLFTMADSNPFLSP